MGDEGERSRRPLNPFSDNETGVRRSHRRSRESKVPPSKRIPDCRELWMIINRG